jgi:Uma2 family endonuclease
VSLTETNTEVEYPESDGLPMRETDLHRWWMTRIGEWLRWRYQGQRVYVSGNLLIYPEEGNNMRHVSPDCFVVLDCEPGFRRTYKLWEEGKAPDFVLEVTSSSTRRQDEDDKPSRYAEMGVKEYFLFDPTSDYLEPPLQGYRFVERRPVLIRPNSAGELESRCLGLLLKLEGADLVMSDRKTGERLLTQAEFEQAKRKQVEDQLRAAEAELAKLRQRLGQEPSSE